MPIRETGIEDRKNVGMLQSREQAYLALESLGPRSGGRVGSQDLYRNLTVVLPILGEKDRCHSAATDLTTDGVVASDSRLKGIEIDDRSRPRPSPA
jgi:hypothetical protein